TSACFSIQAVGVGIYISYGVFFNPLMEAFDWPRAAISGASSAAFFITGLFAMVVGRLNDRFGPRILMSIAAVFLGLGFGFMSRVSTLFQLYLIFGLFFGIGLSAVDVIALSTIARWYSLNRGKMTGIVKVGTGAGQFTIPIIASFLIAWTGFQNAFIIMGISAFILLMAIAQFLYRDPDIYYGAAAGASGTGGAAVDAAAAAVAAGPAGAAVYTGIRPVQTAGMDFSRAVKSAKLWLLCLSFLLTAFCLMSIMIHIVPHGRDMGIPPHRAAGVLAAIGAVSMLGRFASGMLIDRTGSKTIMVISFVLLLFALTWLTLADTLWKLYAFAMVYGIAHGGFFTAISPIVAELFGIRSHGSLFGIVVFSGTTGGALGPFVTGFLFDMFQNYAAAFLVLIAITCIAFGLLLCLKVGVRR
ncbi:MAG: MFS transporter, partial [Desulfobacteraceae bacterium]|nr:MFS transporter [Desulfobacteraceae bacterium]